jgi:putative DNA methylase
VSKRRSRRVQQLYQESLSARSQRHLAQPLYHSAKWWARRLAAVTSWMVEDAVGKDPGLVVDPFAGSGTTLGEALRLGHRAIGVEINFFAATLTKEAFAKRHNELADTYRVITSEALSEVEPERRGHKPDTAA